MSTGIGPDNIDIVINELDALVNIDLETEPKETLTSLNIIQLEPPALCKLIFCG
jgi:uridine phosphorylase